MQSIREQMNPAERILQVMNNIGSKFSHHHQIFIGYFFIDQAFQFMGKFIERFNQFTDFILALHIDGGVQITLTIF